MRPVHVVLPLLSAFANTIGQLCGVGGRPFLQVLFQAVFVDSIRTSAEVIATALLVNIIAFSLGVPGYGALGLYDSRLVLNIATVSVPAAILGASASGYVTEKLLRLCYAGLAAVAAAALAARARRLSPPKSAPVSERSLLVPITSDHCTLPTDVFSREGNFLLTDDVERLSLLDDSDAEDDGLVESAQPGQIDRSYQNKLLNMLASSRRILSASISSTISFVRSTYALLSPSANSSGVVDIRNNGHKAVPYQLTRVLSASVSSLNTLSTTAQSFISMSASATSTFLPTDEPIPAMYGSLYSNTQLSWPLLDLALARYHRPSLTTSDKSALAFGGLLCGALGVGVPESVLIVLVGLHNVPLAAAATTAISVAFYAQMVASMMDAIATTADATSPRIAESVPWALVLALVPGVVVGALVGPRLHAFVKESRMLLVASVTLMLVSIAVAIVGSTS